MILYIGTKSDLKLQAVKQTLDAHRDSIPDYHIIGERTKSRVPTTPFGEQAINGATNRARALYESYKDKGDLFVGLESGLVERHGYLFEECWCYIIDKYGGEWVGYSSGYQLPQRVHKHITDGGNHTDILNTLEQEKQISRKNTWAIYTNNRISRVQSILEAFRNAFIAYLADITKV